jgi:hypothetical protein
LITFSFTTAEDTTIAHSYLMFVFGTLCTFPLCNSAIIIIQLLELCLAGCSGNVCMQGVEFWASKVGTYGRCVRIRLIFCIYMMFGSGGNLNIFFLQEYLPHIWGKDVIGILCILMLSLSHSILSSLSH